MVLRETRQFCFPEGPDVSRDEVLSFGKQNYLVSLGTVHLVYIVVIWQWFFSIYFFFRLKAKFLAVLRLSVNPIETLDDTSQPWAQNLCCMEFNRSIDHSVATKLVS